MDSFRPDYYNNSLYFDNVASGIGSGLLQNTSTKLTDSALRLTNPIKLRSTAKNSMVTYSAMQKVFRSRFDEGCSNTHMNLLSNTFTPIPFISEARVPYESLLGKNRDSFFNVNFYNQNLKDTFSDLYAISNSLNIYFSDLPFLMSRSSDPSRYLWFD